MCVLAGPVFAQEAPQAVLKPAKQIDPVWNGVLIGAGAGVVTTWIFTRANCGPAGYDSECSAIATLGGLAIFVPSGMLAGGIIDRLINKTLPPGTSARASVSPLLAQRGTRRNAGVALNLKIRF
jgi:hypothetical protein